MKTSSFFLYQGAGRLSIARFAPRGTPAGFRLYKRLAPGPWFKSVAEPEYRDLYFREVLGVLDPLQVWEALHTLAGSAEPVLLCYERLIPVGHAGHIPGEFCHRRMVAEWFAETLGYDVPELPAPAAAH